MLLGGDIGGTKTVLALYAIERGVLGEALHETRFASGSYGCLEDIVAEFLRETGAQPVAASFGVAGPVTDRRHARITNLPWTISADNIGSSFGIRDVYLLNDLRAIAVAVPHLEPDAICTLHRGTPRPRGNIAVVAPGTGLGTAFLVWTGERYIACASEGGHASFSPHTAQEIGLLEYLQGRYGHVSFERIASGRHLPDIYDFFSERCGYVEPGWLRDALSQAPDRTPVIVRTALANRAEICEATLDLFVHVLATITGNLAVTLLPSGGIYLAGGIPPRILDRLQRPDFLDAIADKGRFSHLTASMPVHVILDPGVALSGAAWFGLEALQQQAAAG